MLEHKCEIILQYFTNILQILQILLYISNGLRYLGTLSCKKSPCFILKRLTLCLVVLTVLHSLPHREFYSLNMVGEGGRNQIVEISIDIDTPQGESPEIFASSSYTINLCIRSNTFRFEYLTYQYSVLTQRSYVKDGFEFHTSN